MGVHTRVGTHAWRPVLITMLFVHLIFIVRLPSLCSSHPTLPPALLFVAVVTEQPWLQHTKRSPSPRPSAFWRAHLKSGACTPSSGNKKDFTCTAKTAIQVTKLLTILYLLITFRNKETSRDEFIFYSKRLMRLLIERALSFLPSQVLKTVNLFIIL